MDHRPIERPPGAFQQPVAAGVVEAMCRRAFGAGTRVVSAVEIGSGSYNTTYRVDLGQDRPVILRIAPEPARQYRSEREFMRNEHLALPWFAPIAALMPRTLAVDFTHDLTGRDYLFQTHLDGLPAPEGLQRHPRETHAPFYRGIGATARTVHAVRGTAFGPANGPTHATWSAALARAFEDMAADCADAGLDHEDLLRTAALAREQHAVLDEVTEPRLLHGDLWTVNLMIDPDAPEPVITGVLDSDRVWWGDPEADWTVHVASSPAARPGNGREAFWEAYGPLTDTPAAGRRRLFYRARHTGAVRLESHRLGRPGDLPATYATLRGILDALTQD